MKKVYFNKESFNKASNDIKFKQLVNSIDRYMLKEVSNGRFKCEDIILKTDVDMRNRILEHYRNQGFCTVYKPEITHVQSENLILKWGKKYLKPQFTRAHEMNRISELIHKCTTYSNTTMINITIDDFAEYVVCKMLVDMSLGDKHTIIHLNEVTRDWFFGEISDGLKQKGFDIVIDHYDEVRVTWD